MTSKDCGGRGKVVGFVRRLPYGSLLRNWLSRRGIARIFNIFARMPSGQHADPIIPFDIGFGAQDMIHVFGRFRAAFYYGNIFPRLANEKCVPIGIAVGCGIASRLLATDLSARNVNVP